MKIATEKKQLPKWTKYAVIAGILVVVIVVMVVVKSLIKPKNSIYDTIDTFMAQETCNFRYILNVRSEEHKEDSQTVSLEDYMNEVSFDESEDNGETTGTLNSYESEEDNANEDRSQTGSLYGDRINAEWGTADGSKTINWDYPNYEIVITGRTESVEPLKCALKMQISTEYTSASFCNMAFIDNKCYIDIKTLRDWLLSAEDANLVALAEKIPDNTVYVEVSEDNLRFVTPYAELGEEEFSGALGITDYYRRCMIIEKIITQGLKNGLGDTGMTSEEGKCRLSISGDSAVKLVNTVGGMLTNASGAYSTYTKSLVNNDMVSEDEVAQLANEKDNFLSDMSSLWAKFNMLTTDDIKNMDLNVLGKSNKYTASTGGGVLELNLGMSFTFDNTDYILTLYGCKQDLSVASPITVEVPKETSIPVENISKEYDLGYVKNYLLYYFKFREADNSERLEVSLESLQQGVLNDFIELVNQTNSQLGGGITKQNVFTIESYIARYANMDEENAMVNEVTKANYNLVKNFLGVLQTIENIQNVEDTTDTAAPAYLNVKKTVGKCEISANVDINNTNSKLLVINLSLNNLSEQSQKLELSKWYVIDSAGNKYPCNYSIQLKDMDSNFDTSKVQETVELKESEKKNAVLYVVISNVNSSLVLYTESEELGQIVE